MGFGQQITCKSMYWPTDVTKITDLLDFLFTRNVSTNFVNVEAKFYVVSYQGFDMKRRCKGH